MKNTKEMLLIKVEDLVPSPRIAPQRCRPCWRGTPTRPRWR